VTPCFSIQTDNSIRSSECDPGRRAEAGREGAGASPGTRAAILMLVADHEKIFLVWLIAITMVIVGSLIPGEVPPPAQPGRHFYDKPVL
jgi:hypothetical protein